MKSSRENLVYGTKCANACDVRSTGWPARRASWNPWGSDCAEAGADGAQAELRVQEAVGLLAREWPEDYPAGAVEWLVASSIGIPDFVCVS